MADDDEFNHIVKNSQTSLGLNDQYENHPYVKEFKKGCRVMFVYGTYVLEGEADAKISFGDIWNLFQRDTLSNNASNFCSQMIKCIKTWNYLQKTSGLPLSTEVIKKTRKTMMKDEKDVLAGEYRKSPVFVGYHAFAPTGHIERYMECAIFRFHEMVKDGIGRICCLILAHVLIQMKCCLFPVILSSFHRRGRRHYIRAVKMFDRKPSMLYTMIVKSLIHCWDNFEQDAGMTSPGPEI